MKIIDLNQHLAKITTISLSVLLILVIGVYLAYFLTLPNKIKQTTTTTHQVFIEYSDTIFQISNHLLKGNNTSDSDSIARESQKATNLVQQALTSQKTLNTLLSKLTFSQQQNYRQEILNYQQLTNQLIELEQANAILYQQYAPLIAQYEQLEIKVNTINNYMISDPTKYTTEIQDIISQEQILIEQFQQIQTIPQFQELVTETSQPLVAELALLKSLSQGVKTRNTNLITQSNQKYIEDQVKINKNLNRIEDELTSQIGSLTRNIEKSEDQIKSSYTRLAIQHNF